jgi:hypothetical protein
VNDEGRSLNEAEIEALTYWPGAGDQVPTPPDLTVLPPLFNALLDEWPWWNRDWRVTEVEPAYPRLSPEWPETTGLTEVTVPGLVGSSPMVARVRFCDDRLLRFELKVAEVVIGPGSAGAGEAEPHPFGAVLTALMDRREITARQMARKTYRAESTIRMARRGHRIPRPKLVRELARALDLPEEDLLAMAGLVDD